VLATVLPIPLLPAMFTFLAFTLAGWGMLALARRYTSPGGALLAAAAYVANPYMLFTAFERTAYAELLAAAWMPWLLRAALAGRPTLIAVSVPVALLWLTNAPAAVMGTYALVLVALVRLGWRWYHARGLGLPFQAWLREQGSLLGGCAGGLLLGLALAGFYLIPAAWERRYVQIAMAIIPNMRVEDNFLFGHTGYGPHDQVLHTASLVAVSVAGLTVLVLLLAYAGRQPSAQQPRLTLLPEQRFGLTVLALTATVLLFHGTLPVWRLLPEMTFLQFPWRLLAVLGCVFGAGCALALRRYQVAIPLSIALSLLIAAVSAPLALRPFRQGCEIDDFPQQRLVLFASHHGVGPTDEYTPTEADNDQLRWDDPSWWLSSNANAPGPHTVPNPAATILDYDQPPPLEQTVSGQAPTHLQLDLPYPQWLILNLRDYPAWNILVNGRKATHMQRDDGLVALSLPSGASDIEVRWRRLPDVWLGDGVTLCALVTFGWIVMRSRRIRA
jgi:hypothetical protein